MSRAITDPILVALAKELIKLVSSIFAGQSTREAALDTLERSAETLRGHLTPDGRARAEAAFQAARAAKLAKK
jgi:hypothetical protein